MLSFRSGLILLCVLHCSAGSYAIENMGPAGGLHGRVPCAIKRTQKGKKKQISVGLRWCGVDGYLWSTLAVGFVSGFVASFQLNIVLVGGYVYNKNRNN